jgi:hypothetical protein
MEEHCGHVLVGDALLCCGVVVVAVVYAFVEEKPEIFRCAMTKVSVLPEYLSKCLLVREPALTAQAC